MQMAYSTLFINNEVVICRGTVKINGEKLPPCPAKFHNVTVINRKVYIGGYEFKNGKWKRTLKALWHNLF